MTEWVVRRWARHGHERLYAETPGGTALGYLDLKTGAVSLGRLVQRAVAEEGDQPTTCVR